LSNAASKVFSEDDYRSAFEFKRLNYEEEEERYREESSVREIGRERKDKVSIHYFMDVKCKHKLSKFR
jgi:hypothetical protein